MSIDATRYKEHETKVGGESLKKQNENEITQLKERQEKFELLILSLVDSGQLKPNATATNKKIIKILSISISEEYTYSS
jgi:hypothetical protein